MRGREPTISDYFLDAVARRAGERGLRKLRRMYAGREISVPMYPHGCSPITLCLGIEAARAVCRDMRVRDADGRLIGRLRVPVPLGPDSQNRKMLARLDALLIAGRGRAVRDIAVEAGCHARTAFRRRAKLRADGVLRVCS